MNASNTQQQDNGLRTDRSYKKNPQHKKQSFWQIWFPLLICVTVLIALAILLVITSSTNHAPSHGWANISIIIMVLLAAIPGFILLIFLAGFNYGIGKLIAIAPVYIRIGVTYVNKAADILHEGADKIVAPLLSIKSSIAGGEALISQLRRLAIRSKGNS